MGLGPLKWYDICSRLAGDLMDEAFRRGEWERNEERVKAFVFLRDRLLDETNEMQRMYSDFKGALQMIVKTEPPESRALQIAAEALNRWQKIS